MKIDARIKEINQADLRWLHFPKEDVFFTAQEKKKRAVRIQALKMKAAPVQITFQDVEGAKRIEAVIENHTNDAIQLKGSPAIPVHRILRIDQY
jgi:uncharacterized protein (UPF0248 family)